MMRFQATIRYWRPEQARGLAVADIPAEHVATLFEIERAAPASLPQ